MLTDQKPLQPTSGSVASVTRARAPWFGAMIALGNINMTENIWIETKYSAQIANCVARASAFAADGLGQAKKKPRRRGFNSGLQD